MLKRKPLYIILLIVFTLLLGADILAYGLLGGASPAMPEGFAMPQTPGSSEAEGSFGMPGMSGGTSDASGDTDGGWPGGFDSAQIPDGMGERPARPGAAFALAGFVRRWWIPIGLFCVLADAAGAFMLIRISRKRGAAGVPDTAGTVQPDAPAPGKPELSGYEKRRRKKRRTIRAAVVMLSAAALAVTGYLAVRSLYLAQLADEDAVSVVSAQAADAGIDTGISGTGTLADADAEEITVPGGVEIDAFWVADGDQVEEGDVLATVDHTSVMLTIAKVQDAMDALDAQIEDATSDKIDAAITTSVAGRVKMIYAEAGAGVDDVMYENGALLLISLDGLMAADIETDVSVSAGESVTVTLADGTTVAGRVARAAGGVVTVTVPDDSGGYGEEVSVSDGNGSVLGTSALSIHSELKVTGFSGTVSAIKCGVNDKVKAGQTLIRLTDTAYTAQYQLLLKQRSDYVQAMETLVKLRSDGNIYAGFAGTVSGVDEQSTAGGAGESTNNAAVAASGYSVATLTGYAHVSRAYESASGETGLTLLSNNPKGVDESTAALYSNTVATVSAVAYNAISMMAYPANVSISDYADFGSLGISAEMMTTAAQISPAADTPVYAFENGAWASRSLSDIGAGDTLILSCDTSQGADSFVWIVIAAKGETGTPAAAGGSHSASSSAASAEAEETEEAYTVTETTVMSLTPSDKMSVTITVDELDILSLKTGQEAAVTLDAISGRAFLGSVDSIDMAGTNSGGSTKFAAVVTLDKTDQMLSGMNAAVSITLSSTDCAVAIPVAALCESKTDTFVYTAYDEETGELSAPVSVTAGISDGMTVEILSGLGAGDTVWYEYDDTVSITSSAVSSNSAGGFNLMSLFGGGRPNRS